MSSRVTRRGGGSCRYHGPFCWRGFLTVHQKGLKSTMQVFIFPAISFVCVGVCVFGFVTTNCTFLPLSGPLILFFVLASTFYKVCQGPLEMIMVSFPHCGMISAIMESFLHCGNLVSGGALKVVSIIHVIQLQCLSILHPTAGFKLDLAVKRKRFGTGRIEWSTLSCSSIQYIEIHIFVQPPLIFFQHLLVQCPQSAKCWKNIHPVWCSFVFWSLFKQSSYFEIFNIFLSSNLAFIVKECVLSWFPKPNSNASQADSCFKWKLKHQTYIRFLNCVSATFALLKCATYHALIQKQPMQLIIFHMLENASFCPSCGQNSRLIMAIQFNLASHNNHVWPSCESSMIQVSWCATKKQHPCILTVTSVSCSHTVSFVYIVFQWIELIQDWNFYNVSTSFQSLSIKMIGKWAGWRQDVLKVIDAAQFLQHECLANTVT